MCLSSSVSASGKSARKRVDTVSQSCWPLPLRTTGFHSERGPFNLGLIGSFSSLLHEKYSMEELRE